MDLVELSRIESSINKFGENFLTRILTKEELEYLTPQRQLTFVAGRFAAKEAFGKALGTGLKGISLKDIRVTTARSGKPELSLGGTAEKALRNSGGRRVHLSLTHDGALAIAQVIIEGEDHV